MGASSGKMKNVKPVADLDQEPRLAMQTRTDLSVVQSKSLPAWMEWGSFENFGHTQIKKRVLLARPKNLEEVRETIQYAREHKLRVRAGGKCHSWSPLYTDEGHIVLFTRDIQDEGPRISVNSERSEVTIMTGVNTGELKKFLLDNQLTIRSNVILQVVEMGGVVGSICHGVGNTEGTVSDTVVEMRIVNSGGELVTYDFRGVNSDTDRTHAVKGHLGMFGIVYDMKLRVEEEIMVDVVNVWETVQDVFYDGGRLKTLLDDNWSAEFFWFPFNCMSWTDIYRVIASEKGQIDASMWDPKKDLIWVRLINPTKNKMTSLRPMEHEHNPHVYRGVPLARFTPLALKVAADILYYLYLPDVVHTEPLMYAIHYEPASFLASKVPSLDLEVAIDAGVDYVNVVTALNDFQELLREYVSRGRYPINIALEMRMVRNSKILLAPAQAGNPYTMYIEVLSLRHTESWEDFLRDLTRRWKKISGCRFHWAKQWRVLGGNIDNFVRKSYGENIAKFKHELESSGADPDRMFFNAMLDSMFYPDNASLQREMSRP